MTMDVAQIELYKNEGNTTIMSSTQLNSDIKYDLRLLTGELVYWRELDYEHLVGESSHTNISHKDLLHANLVTRSQVKTGQVVIGKLNTIDWKKSFPMICNENQDDDEELEEELSCALYVMKAKLIKTLHAMSQ